MTNKHIVTARAVSSCHPDAVCDLIADKIVDECLREDRNARMDIMVRMTEDKVAVTGDITGHELPDIPHIISKTVREAGYGSLYEIEIALDGRFERVSALSLSDPARENGCSGNECIGQCTSLSCGDIPADETITVSAHATAETAELLPLSEVLANRIMSCFSLARGLNAIPGLLPGASVCISVAYENKKAVGLASVKLTLGCAPDSDRDEICRLTRSLILDPSLTQLPITDETGVDIRVVIADMDDCLPCGQSGLNARPDRENCSPNGKDGRFPSRSALCMERYVSKNIVAAGLADECTVSAAYAVGRAEPEVSVDTHGTGEYADALLAQAVSCLFDFRIAAMIPVFRLNRPGFAAYYGGKLFMNQSALWEQTDAIGKLRQRCYELEQEDDEY